MLKKWIFIIGFLISSSAFSNLYVAPYGGTSKLGADNPDLKNKFKGSTLGFNLGYKFLFLAAEAGMRSSSVDGTVPHSVFSSTASSTDTLSVDMKDRMFLFGGRVFFLFSILDIHGGLAFHKLDTTILNNGTDISGNSEFDSIKGNDDGIYWGVGAQIPLPKIDLFVNLDVFSLTSTAFVETVFGVRFFL